MDDLEQGRPVRCLVDEPVLKGDCVMLDPLRHPYVRKAKFDMLSHWDVGVAETDQPQVGGEVMVTFGGVVFMARAAAPKETP